MKYYAVTEDPNELLHYGRLGMKWGKHIFGDKQKSSGYKRALGKLRASANKTKTAIQKSSTQRAVNKQNKQQERYTKAVEKTQKKINMIEGLNDLNHLKDIERSANRAHKEEQRFIRSEAKMQKYNARSERKAEKQALKYARNEKHMDKYLQQARHGKLKYGKLSDEQVREITDRLNMERSARMLGSAEKTWRQQKRDALRTGKLKGIEAGTAAAMTEVARAGAQYGIQHLMNRKKLDAMAKYNAKRQKEADRIKNHKTHKEVKQDIRDDLYEEAIKEGQGMFARRAVFAKGAGKKLNNIEAKRLEDERVRKLNARIHDEMDAGNNETYQKFLADQREKKRTQDVQDRLNNDIDERWRKHLAETGASDNEARAKVYGVDAVDKADKESAQNQRFKILNDAEKQKNESAYQSMLLQRSAEEDHQREIAKLESENKKLKADYEDKHREYERDAEYDKKLKDKFDKETADYNRAVAEFKSKMDDYNTQHNAWVKNKQRYGYYSVEPAKPVFTATKPNPPKYRNTPEPKKPKYHDIDYSEPRTVPMLPSTYEEYMRLKGLYGNGGGKKKNK